MTHKKGGYTYTTPQRGEMFRTHETGTCAKPIPLNLEPRKRTPIEYIGLVCLVPIASLAIVFGLLLNKIQHYSEFGLENHPLNQTKRYNV